MVSLLLGAAPSTGDLSQIASAFTYDFGYTFYQIFLVVISIFSVWIIINAQQIPIVHEIVNYIFILLIYYAFKYSFTGVIRLSQGNFKNRRLPGSNRIKRRRVMRQLHPKRTREKEAQW